VIAMADPVHWVLAATASSFNTIRVILLIVSLFVSGFSSASETALTSVNRVRIKNLAEEGNARAERIDKLLENRSLFLTTILLVNNVSVILASSMATIIAIDFSPQWGEVIATLGTAIVVLIFCEVTPKNAALRNADRLSLALIPSISAIMWLLGPLARGLTAITDAISRLLRLPLASAEPSITEAELRLLVNAGEVAGEVEADERTMIHHIFELSGTTAREVMVPRIDMVALEARTSLTEAADTIVQVGFSRIPVYDGKIDNIVGLLYAKDVLARLRANQGHATVRAMMRPVNFVLETKKLDDLLTEMREKRIHMAIVSNEYGEVSGLVTIEDVVEEIVGDIQDEFDHEGKPYERLSPTTYLVDGKMNLDDFNELLEVELEGDEEFDTVGGFVLAKLDKTLPSINDTVETDEVTLTVADARGRRILKIRAVLHRPENEVPAEGNAYAEVTPEESAPEEPISDDAPEAEEPPSVTPHNGDTGVPATHSSEGTPPRSLTASSPDATSPRTASYPHARRRRAARR
jgi:putative hemolysin